MKTTLLSLATAASSILPMSVFWYEAQTGIVARYESGQVEQTLRARHKDFDSAYQGREYNKESRYLAPIRRFVDAYKCSTGQKTLCEARFAW